MKSELSFQISFADAMSKQHWGVARWERGSYPEETQLALHAARNEVTGFQFRISAQEDFVLVLDQANWLHPLGFLPRVRLEVRFPSLLRDIVEVFPVGYVEGDDRRLWMEYFDRAGYMDVPADRPQAVYVRLRVPANASIGEHVGQLLAYAQQGFEDEQQIWEGAVRLVVHDVLLPDARDFSFHLNLWQHLTSLARYYHVPLWSDAHFAIIDRYYASLAELGQKGVTVVVSEFPWSGQRCYRDTGYPSYLFEHSTVAVRRTAGGELMLDFSAFDRVLALAARHGIDREIDLYGLINIWVDEAYGFGKTAQDAPDAVRVRCYDEVSERFTYLRTTEELSSYIRALHDHLEDLGVLERVRVSADEPADLEAFKRSLEFVRAAGPGFRYGAAINHFEFLEDAPQGLLDFVPVLPLACRDSALTARLADELHQKGGRMSWYVCCWPPIPNTFVHSPLVESRLLGWLNYALKLDGLLRWAYCLWPADPWRRISWRAPDWSAGDMYFVLPGNDGAPVETLRYEALRFAVQDYELIRMVERELPEEQSKAVIQKAMDCILSKDALAGLANPRNANASELYSLDPADYHRAKEILLIALARRPGKA